MRWLWGIPGILLLIPTQTLLLESVEILGIKPDLSLVLTYCLGWRLGWPQGVLWGMALGGLMDIFSVGVLGVNFFLKAVIGLIAGVMGRSVFDPSLWGRGVIFFLISLLHDFLGGVFLYRVANFLPVHEMLFRGVYNSVLMLIFVFIFLEKGLIQHGGSLLSSRGESSSTP